MSTPTVDEEIKRTLDWISERRGAGEPCDECGQPLVAGEAYAVTTVQTSLGKVFYITCTYCSSGKCSKVRAMCNDFLAIHRAGLADPNWPRLASDEAAEAIEQVMESERAPSEGTRWVRWVQ